MKKANLPDSQDEDRKSMSWKDPRRKRGCQTDIDQDTLELGDLEGHTASLLLSSCLTLPGNY